MCTTPHNPNNVDLSRDVLFYLTTPEKSKLDVERTDKNVWPSLNVAINILEKIKEKATGILGDQNIINDQLIRLKALRCWFMTQRNIAAWIFGVYGYINTNNNSVKKEKINLVRDMINKEIKNSEELISLLNSDVEFIALTDKGETPLVYGDNLKELLKVRIELMKEHINDEPAIDPNYIEKKAGEIINSFI